MFSIEQDRIMHFLERRERESCQLQACRSSIQHKNLSPYMFMVISSQITRTILTRVQVKCISRINPSS